MNVTDGLLRPLSHHCESQVSLLQLQTWKNLCVTQMMTFTQICREPCNRNSPAHCKWWWIMVFYNTIIIKTDMENHEIFPKREIKTWKYFSIVLRNIGYLKWNKNHTRTHVKHQIFSGAHPSNCTMRFTRRKVNNITEEGSETEVWGHVDESGYAILRVGEGRKRIFWQAWGNRPPD